MTNHVFNYITAEIEEELNGKSSQYPPFHSSHEAFAVMKEEIDETWDAIRDNDPKQQRAELIQVLAMGFKFIYMIDCLPNNSIIKADNPVKE